MTDVIQLRRGTSVQWATTNPILSAGELGLETDTVRFKFGDGNTPWNNLPYAAAAANAAAPANVTQPTITGSVTVGSVLVANPGVWSPSATTYTYQWFQRPTTSGGGLLSDGVAIGPATQNIYTLQASDAGMAVYVEVTASNQSGPGLPANSLDTPIVTTAAAPVPANTALPTVSGTPQAGQTLTANPGTWSNTPTSYRYQWGTTASNVFIGGAQSSTYVVQASDIGNKLSVLVWASNANGESASAVSAVTAAVTAAPAVSAPVNTSVPYVGGTPQVGAQMLCNAGTWSNSPTSYAFQWKWYVAPGQNGLYIAGATSQGYFPVAADVGHQLYCAVTATNSGGSGYAFSDPPTAVVTASGGGGGGSASVNRVPTGPSVPTGGWSVVLADAFAGPNLSSLWYPNYHTSDANGNSQGFNPPPGGTELEVFNPSQVSIDSRGLVLTCVPASNVPNFSWAQAKSGCITSDPNHIANGFTWVPGNGGTFCFEAVFANAVSPGGSGCDASWWSYGSGGAGINDEIDFIEQWAWLNPSNSTWGTWIGNGSQLAGATPAQLEDQQTHRWTHQFTDLGSGAGLTGVKLDVWIDGNYFAGKTFSTTFQRTLQLHLIFDLAYRKFVPSSPTYMVARSLAVYRDTPNVGNSYSGGGIASGTTLV